MNSKEKSTPHGASPFWRRRSDFGGQGLAGVRASNASNTYVGT